MSDPRHAPTPQAPELLVQLSTAQLHALVADAVTEALAAHEPTTPPALLDQSALALALGTSTRTVYTLRQQGLPTVWLLESPRFELGEVLAWLRSRSNDSAELDPHGETPVAKVEVPAAQVTDIARVRAGKRKLDQLTRAGSRGAR
jgi:hypothetical protein